MTVNRFESFGGSKSEIGRKVKVLPVWPPDRLNKKERKDLAVKRLFKGKLETQCPCCKKGKKIPI